MTKKLNETHAAYYSSPESHSEKMNAYIHFFVAAEEGDIESMVQLSTSDIPNGNHFAAENV